MRYWKFAAGVFLTGLLALVGCSFNTNPDITPTAEITLLPTTSPIPSPTPSATPTTAGTIEAVIERPTATETPAPPSETFTPSPTLGPYEHVVKPGETLLYIVQLYGYTDFGVIPEVMRLNNMASPDALIAGNTILIPRQTATPVPAGLELTQSADATLGFASTAGARLPMNTNIACYNVQEGDTIVGIALDYNTTLEIISQLNPNLGWYGCNFSNYSGGPDCKPSIKPGDCIKVPAPTATPTLSPTPSGSETATLTPTYPAPMVVFPPEGGIAPASPIRLQWVSVGVLGEHEFYLVQLTDTTNGAQFNQVTQNTFMDLPASLIPLDGKTHNITWSVNVAVPNEQGVYRVVSGGAPQRTFQWQSR